jgi:hypothetical protein
MNPNRAANFLKLATQVVTLATALVALARAAGWF